MNTGRKVAYLEGVILSVIAKDLAAASTNHRDASEYLSMTCCHGLGRIRERCFRAPPSVFIRVHLWLNPPPMQSPKELVVEPVGLDVDKLARPIDWAALFGNDHPIELEIGIGK